MFRSLWNSGLPVSGGSAVVALVSGSVFLAARYSIGRTSAEENVQDKQADQPSPGDSSETTAADGMFHGQCLHRQLYRPKLPYPAWDYDWDGRMNSDTTLERLLHPEGLEQSRRSGKIRHILLIRHGQYDETYPDDKRRVLTQLGRRQAELTGQRLAALARGGSSETGSQRPCRISVIRTSDMTRAKETASIIATHLPAVPLADPDPLLNEALPSPMIPARPDILNAEKEIDDNHDRIEKGFRKYFYRAEARQDDGASEEMKHEFEVIVCHANIIRYFFCRALQLPPEAWLRMSLFNCSITYLMILPNGYVSARMVGDHGHLTYDDTTFSGFHGYQW